MKSIHASVRRWFDSTGNTYHTAQIILGGYGKDGATRVETMPMRYGYGSHYETTIGEFLTELGIFEKMPDGRSQALTSRWGRESGVSVTFDVCDVTRKRDLH
jgi:hypothetical protein